ncbi:MAG: transglutaminase N-terminal domain-containing protein [Dermatophilaceae bacterium]|nr:transglutaminase family protein [Intrasporangiaceae bacterium]
MSQSDADFEPRRYAVRHRTAYTYTEPVIACYERGFLSFRATPTQRLVSSDLTVDPEPAIVTERVDWQGNPSHYLEVRGPHTSLTVTKEALVDVAWPRVDVAALDRWTLASAREEIDGSADPWERATFLLPSPVVGAHPEVTEYARRHLEEGDGFGTALSRLLHGIRADFEFRSGATNVNTTLPQFLTIGAGVCQDFAHLTLGALRSVGLVARYVSGYIETTPPPGQEKMEGSDASHAWVSVLTPDGAWVDLDPTNDHFCDSRYIVTAWGRDYRDVSPLKGVIYTDDDETTSSTLHVGVDVTRLD